MLLDIGKQYLDEFNDIDLRPFAAGLFGCGLLVLSVYYTVYFRKDRQTYNME